MEFKQVDFELWSYKDEFEELRKSTIDNAGKISKSDLFHLYNTAETTLVTLFTLYENLVNVCYKNKLAFADMIKGWLTLYRSYINEMVSGGEN